MTSHAGGGEVGYKLVYILYCTGGWCGLKYKERALGGCGGKKNNASFGMKNNVKLIEKTP